MRKLNYENPKARLLKRVDRALSPKRVLIGVIVGFIIYALFFVLNSMFGDF